MKRKSVRLSLAMAGCNIKTFALAAILLTGGMNGATAQKRASSPHRAATVNTLTGINDLTGVDPSSSMFTTTERPEDDYSKIFYFYNPATNQFMNIGGYWGTHATCSSTPFAAWFEKGTTDTNFYINCKVDGSGAGHHLGGAPLGLFWDRSIGGNGDGQLPFTFERAEGYSDSNKVYRIKTDSRGYITIFPDNENASVDFASAYATTNQNYKKQVWKILSKEEYYNLFLTNPANMSAPIDATFLLTAPDFRANNTEISKWTVNNESVKDKIFYGDNYMYSTYESIKKNGSGHFNIVDNNGAHQKPYGNISTALQRVQEIFIFIRILRYMRQDGMFCVATASVLPTATRY